MTTAAVCVYFYGAFVPSSDGCHARVCSLLDRLTEMQHRVLVYSYDNHPEFPWRPANVAAFGVRWPNAELVLERYTGKLKFATRVKNLLVSFFPEWTERVLRVSIPGWTPEFDRLRAEAPVFLVNYTHGLCQMNGIEPQQCFVDTHDVNFAKWAKLTNASSVSVTALRKLRGEMSMLKVARAVVAISPAEAAFFRMMLPTDTTLYVPSWTEPRPCTTDGARERDIDLVFFGSGYAMNARGLCEMLETHGSWLRQYRIAVCGLVCEDKALLTLAKEFPNLTLMGFVAEPRTIYARSKAALSPVDGTGLKMKIVAALEAGIPAFVSRQTLDGLPPGYEGAVFPITQTEVSGLLDHSERLTAARKAAQRYYTTFANTGDTRTALGQLMASGAAPARGDHSGIHTDSPLLTQRPGAAVNAYEGRHSTISFRASLPRSS